MALPVGAEARDTQGPLTDSHPRRPLFSRVRYPIGVRDINKYQYINKNMLPNIWT